MPFCVISFCYICVSVRLNDRAKAKPGTKTTKKEELDRDRKKRTNRMLIAMVAVFGISWLPLNMVNVLNDFYAKTSDWKFYNLLFFLAHSIAMSSTCYNPFLYAWLNDNFRKEFKLVLPGFSSATRARIISGAGGSFRWQPEPTYNGNNETVQESFLTSSFIRNNSTCASVSGLARESIQLNRLKSSGSMTDHSMLLSDVVGSNTTCTTTATNSTKQRSPETVCLPSGVLETNFEDPFESNDATANRPGRLCFEDELTVAFKNADNLNFAS